MTTIANDGRINGGKQWRIRSGDILSRIALTVVGDAGRWTEIVKANPGRKPHPSWGLVLNPGDVIGLPVSWWPAAPSPQPQPVDPEPDQPDEPDEPGVVPDDQPDEPGNDEPDEPNQPTEPAESPAGGGVPILPLAFAAALLGGLI
jgi:hypothetical protein